MIDAIFKKKFQMGQNDLKGFFNNLEGHYYGFIRMADSSAPIWLDNTPLMAFDKLSSTGSFILEAFLYQQGMKSIHIRQENNLWSVVAVDWKGIPPNNSKPEDDFRIYSMLSEGGSRRLRFYEKWLPVDVAGDGWVSLRPAWTAFIGFSEEEK